MATRKTSRAPQQASLFDDPVPETAPADTPSPAPEAPAAGRKPAKKAAEPAVPAAAAVPPRPVTADVPHLAAQFDALPTVWRDVLKPFTDSDAYAPLCRFVDDERAAGKTVYPTDVF
ncbi:MAG: uracil-DNA glycosylase, partial [Burkholderia sp.]|nr:uracil-DNA glycosylase [Burkholderia sp.]